MTGKKTIPTEQLLGQSKTASGGGSNVTFFTICNEAHFPGLVGLLNSLRLMGHEHPLVVADFGLTAKQRELLAPYCTLFKLPSNLARSPMQCKPFPYLLNPKGTIVLIDSDIIVTRNLDAILAIAAGGKICVFPEDTGYQNRWFCEWREIFDLSSSLRHQTYVCTGFVAFSTLHWPLLLERWWKACERIFTHHTHHEGWEISDPTIYADQDALNALLMSELPSDALSLEPFDEQVFRSNFPSVQLTDAQTLNCVYRGHGLTLLHAGGFKKPWQRRGITRDIYLRLLLRLLNGPDVRLKVPPDLLEVWLRKGLLGGLARHFHAFPNIAKRKLAATRVGSFAQRLRRKLRGNLGSLRAALVSKSGSPPAP